MKMNIKLSSCIISAAWLSAFILLTTACTSSQETQSGEEAGSGVEETGEENLVVLNDEQYRIAGIETGRAALRSLGSELRVNGKMDVPPQSHVSVTMPYGGFIKYIDLLAGTKVKKGQLLLTLQNPEFIGFQQEYLEAMARQEYLKAEYERQEKLYSENVSSARTYQEAKSNYLSNSAQIATLEEKLRMVGISTKRVMEGKISSTVSVYSPVNGAVREVYTNVGKYVQPTDIILDITNSEDLHVELTVYENDIPRVQKGQKILFSTSDRPGKTEEAEVFLIGRNVREDRSVTVHGHLKGSHEDYEDLLPGMYITARIVTDRHEMPSVPEGAVVRYGGRQYVFATVENAGESVHVYEMLEVTTGLSEDGYTALMTLEGMDDPSSRELVLQGAYSLLSMAKNVEEE